MASPRHRAPLRLAVLVGVLLLHALVWLGFAALRTPAPTPDPATPEPLWLRWVAPADQRQPAEPTRQTAQAPPAGGQAAGRADPVRAARPAGAAPAQTGTAPEPAPARAAAADRQAAITWAPDAPSAAASAADPAVTASTGASPASVPRLVLDLPRGTSAPRRNPALDDPRSNTARANFESRLAAALGNGAGAITEERLADGTVRLRRGHQCVLVRPSRQAAIDPFNEAVSPKMRGVESCS